jgi:hypothetical protein
MTSASISKRTAESARIAGAAGNAVASDGQPLPTASDQTGAATTARANDEMLCTLCGLRACWTGS